MKLMLKCSLLLLLVTGCKKKNEANSADGFVLTGSNVKVIGTVADYNQEDVSGYSTASVGWDGADNVSWLFHYFTGNVTVAVYTYKGYRKQYRLSTGDSIATGPFPAKFSAKNAGNAKSAFNYAPFTTVLWYPQTVNNQEKLTSDEVPRLYQYPPYGNFELYANGDYIVTNYTGRFLSIGNGALVKNMVTLYSVNGVEKNTTLPLYGYNTAGVNNDIERANSRCQTAALTENGTPLVFSMTGDSLQVFNAETKLQLASAATNALSGYAGLGLAGRMFVQRSRDAKKITGYMFNEKYAPAASEITTFVYETDTRSLRILANKLALPDLKQLAFTYPSISCDEAGNAYYISNNNAIRVVGAAGTISTKAEKFLAADCFVNYLTVIGNRIFFVANKPVRQNIAPNTELNRAALCTLP